MPGTWFARIWRSGSDIVMIIPKSKLTRRISQSFLDFVMLAPTLLPIGAMAVSAPSVNSAIPTISSAAPSTNASSILLGIGEIVKHNSKTIAVIGSTEDRASKAFSRSFDLLFSIRPPPIIHILYIIMKFLKHRK